MTYLRLTAMTLALFTAFSVQSFEPRYHNEVLEERTKLALEIPPGLSTRLVFPFLIDENVNEPTFKVSVPNSTVFTVEEAENSGQASLQEQNTLVIKAKPAEGVTKNTVHYSNVFISVNGYHLTVALKVAPLMPEKYYTDVFFSLTEKDQAYLINKIVDKKIESLEKVYQEKEKDLARLAKKEAIKNISSIALAEPDDYGIKEEYDLEFDNGQRAELYVDKAISFDGHYFVLAFELENKSNSDLEIKNIALETMTKKSFGEISTALNCPNVIRARELVKCGLVSENASLFDSKESRMKITTDAGGGLAEW